MSDNLLDKWLPTKEVATLVATAVTVTTIFVGGYFKLSQRLDNLERESQLIKQQFLDALISQNRDLRRDNWTLPMMSEYHRHGGEVHPQDVARRYKVLDDE
jgi:hypothetical protein